MSINEKLKDFSLLIKNDRRVWAIGIGIIAVAGVVLLSESPQRMPIKSLSERRVQQYAGKPSEGGTAAYNDLIRAFKSDIEGLQKDRAATDRQIEKMRTDQSNFQTSARGIFESMVDKIEQLDRTIEKLETDKPQVQVGGGQYDVSPETEGADLLYDDSLDEFGFDQATVPPPPPAPDPARMTFISPGDSVPVQLLTGVNAPVDGTPYPVVFKLAGPITGPDGSSLELGEARIVAAAQGSEADGRALFRLVDMAIRHPDGRRSVVKVDGWIVGEDGVRGMQGRVIDKLGRLIAATAGISFVSAIGDRIDGQAGGIQIENSDNISLGAEDLDVASASALTDASNRLGNLLLERYEKLVPVVEILSGRQVAAVFSKPIEVSVHDEEFDEGIYSASYLD